MGMSEYSRLVGQCRSTIGGSKFAIAQFELYFRIVIRQNRQHGCDRAGASGSRNTSWRS
jgi:hypothetical protein